MESATDYSVRYVEKASRVELFVRVIWAIPSYVVLFFLFILFAVSKGLQFFHILLLGKRHRALHNWIYMFISYAAHFESYASLLTDERSPIMPEN